MSFKNFITRQRVAIFLVGLLVFIVTLIIATVTGYQTQWGELSIDLAASAVTVIFTSLIIDYLNAREKVSKTKSATTLAEEEIRVCCFRIKWSMARLFGLERQRSGRNKISNRTEAREYLDKVGHEVTNYLKTNSIEKAPLQESRFQKYLDRLQTARTELEQTLILYEYAMDYGLKERVLHLRTELEISENLLGFIDFSESLNEANVSLIRVQSQTLYDEIENVLHYDSSTIRGAKIRHNKSRLQ